MELAQWAASLFVDCGALQTIMTTNLLALILLATMVGITLVLGARYHQLRRNYYFGIAMWARWLPVAATGIYLAALAVNLAPISELENHTLSLGGVFSTLEIVVLFLVGPLFLTRLGNILAAAAVAYSVERLLADSGTGAPNIGLFLVSGAATVVAVLGDKMPWRAAEGPQFLLHRIREIALVALAVSSLGVVAAGLLKVHGFEHWLDARFGTSASDPILLGIMLALFIGWLTVALGMTRHFTIPLLGLPTLLVLAYVTAWPSSLLVIPFALCLSLSLATAERRSQGVRRATGFKTTFAFTR